MRVRSCGFLPYLFYYKFGQAFKALRPAGLHSSEVCGCARLQSESDFLRGRRSRVRILRDTAARPSLLQNDNFAANWMSRGVPVVEVMAPKLGPLSMSVKVGMLKLGWFQRLKNSALNLRCVFSVTRKFLPMEKSQFCWNGPRNVLRPRLPKAVVQKFGSTRHCAG